VAFINLGKGYTKCFSSILSAGYGNIIPLTTAGQIFCVLFALFGIPLNVVILNRVGKYMLAIERNFCNFLEKKIDRGVRI